MGIVTAGRVGFADVRWHLPSSGRAAGYLVVAALQDPRKDVLPFRDLFPRESRCG